MTIKEEPNDEQEYSQNLPSAIPTQDIKYEPKAGDDVAMEDLKIGSVFSLTEDSSTSSAPTLAHMNLPASCFNCKQPLMDGETVFQRQSHAELFCSTHCLWTFYQVKKTCHFCLQGITQPQDVLQAEAHNEGTVMDFCSKTCLSSFNYKRVVSTKISLEPIPSQSQCSVCTRYCISKHEIIKQDVVHKICSEPCFLRFCNINKLSICENCHSRCDKSVMLKTEGGSIKLCSAECLTQFKQKNKTMQPCAMCRTSHLMSEMCENQFSEDLVELFCNYSCVMAAKIQAVNAAGTPRNCDLCGKKTLPACHLAMSDASIRNFCSLTCAMTFKESHKDTTPAPTSTTGAADQTQGDFLKAPETLPCAQCRRKIKSAPKVIEKKGKIFFLCSLVCSQEFKSINNITGKCEYCKNESIIDDVKKVNGKDCYFCSDGCRVFFGQELGKKWGKHCGSCAHCSSISKAVVTAKFEGTDKEFCSENCSSQFNLLYCHVITSLVRNVSGKTTESRCLHKLRRGSSPSETEVTVAVLASTVVNRWTYS
ncbi:zinc finger MYM-type protein 4-like [Notothenia coriiceps]|uniref:Zinc finger MYM-type protein 4-like n=1 Tax=Notothenia coriiceps TaxID=8208 RepID=A0A6I9Q703_9TELE|nr:PREDICTED: zinc finger MYM-type protein 4-like [Notothenia coriiceps]